MLEVFTDDFIESLSRALNYFKKLSFVIVDYSIFDNRFPRPPRTIGEIRRAIIHKKHIYFHCRSMLR